MDIRIDVQDAAYRNGREKLEGRLEPSLAPQSTLPTPRSTLRVPSELSQSTEWDSSPWRKSQRDLLVHLSTRAIHPCHLVTPSHLCQGKRNDIQVP